MKLKENDEACARKVGESILRANKSEVICESAGDASEEWLPLAAACEPWCWRWSIRKKRHYSNGFSPQLACDMAAPGVKRVLRLPIVILLTLQQRIVDRNHKAEYSVRFKFGKTSSQRACSIHRVALERSACEGSRCKVRAYSQAFDLFGHSHPTSNRPSVQDLQATVLRSPHWSMIVAPKGLFLQRATKALKDFYTMTSWEEKNKILQAWRLLGRHYERDAQRGALTGYLRALSKNGTHFCIHYFSWTQLNALQAGFFLLPAQELASWVLYP